MNINNINMLGWKFPHQVNAKCLESKYYNNYTNLHSNTYNTNSSVSINNSYI